MEQNRKQELLRYLVEYLAAERGEPGMPNAGADELWHAFRAYVNTRPPVAPDQAFLAAQDELLQGLIAEAGIATVDDAAPSPADGRLRLWRGDITTLAVDAIVNAANSQMLGCWVPGHYCIDNAIHTFAGVQLRLECNDLMRAQGHEEPTAQAKITGAYNLPSHHVIHTVGPIASGHPTDHMRQQLADCYANCLACAAAASLRSIAFCCISTGVFGFPQEEACAIAVRTVGAWLDAHPDASVQTVVFNVFGAADEALYRAQLGL